MLILIIQTVILGIIQGITEWLPISSTGHMILFNSLWPLELSEEFVNLFLVVIQFGSILAVVLLYIKTLWPFKKNSKSTWFMWFKIAATSLPAAVIGLLIDDYLDAHLYTPVVVAVSLIIYGLLFITLENRDSKPTINSIDDISFGKAFAIGFFQCLAMIPGTSRSGSTILGSIWMGFSREVASQYSFFCAIPVMFGASGLKLVKYFMEGALAFSKVELIVLGTGMLVAFLVSIIAIKFLMSYIRKHDFKAFGVYRIILGLAVIAYFFIIK